MPFRLFEDFPVMPSQVGLIGIELRALREDHFLVMKTGQPFFHTAGSINMLRNEDAVIIPDGDRAPVENAMVQDAQRQSVGLDIGTSGLVPLDVSCFQTEVGCVEAHVVTTDSAPVFIRTDDPAPERRIALRLVHSQVRPFQTNRAQDVLVHRLRKMIIQDDPGEFRNHFLVLVEKIIDLRQKSALSVDVEQNLSGDVAATFSVSEILIGCNRPETIVL